MEPSPFGPGNPERPTLAYLFLRFLRIGGLAWGGPIAQIALMHRELVERDQWISETRFKKVLALYQALPGPEAHELAVYFGSIKRGRWGGLLTGLAFMLPGIILITLLAALYSQAAATSDWGDRLLYGARPAVLALLAWGFVMLARRSLTTPVAVVIAVAAAGVSFFVPTLSFAWILAGGGIVALAVALARSQVRPPRTAALFVPIALVWNYVAPSATLWGLAVVSLKAGLLSFGGAYTALPFLQDGAVQDHAWITNEQFLDALALCGLVPAPLIAVGTFVGYLVSGLVGALLATVLIFAPAFAFTMIGHELFERLVNEPRLHEFLLGVTAAVIGLMLVIAGRVGESAFVDAPTVMLGLLAFGLFATRRFPIPLVLGACAGLGLGIQWFLEDFAA